MGGKNEQIPMGNEQKKPKRKQLCFSFQIEGLIQHYPFFVTLNSLLFGNYSQAYLLLYDVTTRYLPENAELEKQNRIG